MSTVVTTTSSVTAFDLIKRALRLLGVYSIGETPAAEEAADALMALNALMGSLSNESLLVFARSTDEIALTAGQASVTVGGSLATVTSERPVQLLDESFIEYGDLSYPLGLLTTGEYNAIGMKTQSGLPASLHADMTMPYVTVYIWPQPEAAMTLNLVSSKVVTAFASLTQDLELPPGYDRMLAYLLAIDIAPEYQREPSPTVKAVAAQARRALKRTNLQVSQLTMPAGIPTYRRSNILEG